MEQQLLKLKNKDGGRTTELEKKKESKVLSESNSLNTIRSLQRNEARH